MNKFLLCFLCGIMVATSSSLFSAGDINDYRENTENLWRVGTGAEDGAYSAISASMLGWGIGLSAAIAILASVLHGGSSNSHAHAHTCP